MLLLMLIPSMLTALSVVREKELGSIANFYAAPATRSEFLLGKQLPYFAVALIQFATLVALAVLLFQVPIKGSLRDAGPRRGHLRAGEHRLRPADVGVRQHARRRRSSRRRSSRFFRRCSSPGMFVPVSSLTGGAWFAAQDLPQHLLPGDQRRHLHQGAGLASLWPNIVALAVIAVVYFGAVRDCCSRKQED